MKLYERFNTSHVTLYHVLKCTHLRKPRCFNTSHVTLYPWTPMEMQPPKTFQYISCYSLSSWEFCHAISFCEFQYISCYSLSSRGLMISGSWRTFQYISCYSLSCIYRRRYRSIFIVSIHLMLLFISNRSWCGGRWRVSIHLMLLFI